ncbi:MAG: serine protein kinase RIO [Thermoplasmatota archaeon]
MAKKDVYDIIDKKFDRKTKKESLIVDADRFKTYDEVFDQQNLDHIFKIMKRGDIETIECPISTGKEANVYRANTSDGEAAVKIYRTSTATFRSFLEYIEGDRRFTRINRSSRGVIYTWARKEHLNLSTLYDAGIRVPKPRSYFRNLLVMDYISYEGKPAPSIRILDADDDEWEEMWDFVINSVRKMFMECSLVHADLSEYNILYNGDPVIIDLGQAVEYHHPMAFQFLGRDLKVISTFFLKKGISTAREDSDRLFKELSDHVAED